MNPYAHYQTSLVCALCSAAVTDVGYRMHLHLAICGNCVDKLIEKALSSITIMVVPQAPGPRGVQ